MRAFVRPLARAWARGRVGVGARPQPSGLGYGYALWRTRLTSWCVSLTLTVRLLWFGADMCLWSACGVPQIPSSLSPRFAQSSRLALSPRRVALGATPHTIAIMLDASVSIA